MGNYCNWPHSITQQQSSLTTGKLGVNSYPAGNARAFSVPLVSSPPWAVERTMHRSHVQTGYPCIPPDLVLYCQVKGLKAVKSWVSSHGYPFSWAKFFTKLRKFTWWLSSSFSNIFLWIFLPEVNFSSRTNRQCWLCW